MDNIRDLFSQRQKIDDLIANKYTKDVTIVFSDVVSSVAYFERKGDVSGRAMLHRYTRLMTPLIEQHSGHMIKISGDAILAYFTEAANGCRCSIAMQKVLRKQTLAQPEEDRIAIRIALHFDRAVIEKDDIHGDIVNVAARVEQRATANEILLSDSVFQEVKNNSEFALAFVCKERLKGKNEKITDLARALRSRAFAAPSFSSLPRILSSEVTAPEQPFCYVVLLMRYGIGLTITARSE